MPARLTDWTLALCTGVAFATGVYSLVTGRAEGRWVFVLHALAGFALALFLAPKLWRVVARLWNRRWDAHTLAGLLATLLTLLVTGTGVAWVAGGTFAFAGFGLLNWHIVFGFVLVAITSWHMLARAKPLRRRDFAGRRAAVRWLGFAAFAAALWPVQAAVASSPRRFTGSRVRGVGADGTPSATWPATSWVADAPRPLDRAAWRLAVAGHVRTPLEVAYGEIAGDDTASAALDCTGGFYTAQTWRGVRVGALLDRAGVREGAGWVRFRSVTGYRWSLPLDEARDALLATHTLYTGNGNGNGNGSGSGGAEAVPLAHGHGGPARLVAPGERGFVWVKWLVAVEVLTAPDPAQLVAIHASGFTPEGRGDIG